MSRIAMITDSSAYMHPEYIEDHDVRVVPLKISWGEESFYEISPVIGTYVGPGTIGAAIYAKS